MGTDLGVSWGFIFALVGILSLSACLELRPFMGVLESWGTNLFAFFVISLFSVLEIDNVCPFFF